MITSLSQETMVKYLVRLFIIFMILPLHEYAHARTAYKLGDDTAMYQGRMTLNPISHIDPIGALCLLLGGFGWAKPVPIDPTRFNRKHSMRFGVAVTALAGPVSNLIAAFIGMIVFRIYILSSVYTNYVTDAAAGEAVKNGPQLLFIMLSSFVSINIGLAVFNLIPIQGDRLLHRPEGRPLVRTERADHPHRVPDPDRHAGALDSARFPEQSDIQRLLVPDELGADAVPLISCRSFHFTCRSLKGRWICCCI